MVGTTTCRGEGDTSPIGDGSGEADSRDAAEVILLMGSGKGGAAWAAGGVEGEEETVVSGSVVGEKIIGAKPEGKEDNLVV